MLSPSRKDQWSSAGMAGVWLVFLTPLFARLLTLTPAQSLLSLTLAAIFIGNYLVSFWRYPQALPETTIDNRAPAGCWIHWAVSVALCTAAFALSILGLAHPGLGVSLIPYVQAHAAYTLTARASLIQLPIALGAACSSALFTEVSITAVASTVIGALILQAMSMFVRREIRAAHVQRLQTLDAARTRERNRIARDLHDLLGHSLTVMVLKAQVIERLIRDDPDQAAHEAHQLREQVREALAQMRATVSAMHTLNIDEQVRAAAEACAAAGIDCTVTDERGADSVFAGACEAAGAWVIREAVTNAIRHSKASRVTIELGPERLRITDDGTGFDAESVRIGTGLQSMRTRARGSQLELRVHSSPAGTTVEVEYDPGAHH